MSPRAIITVENLSDDFQIDPVREDGPVGLNLNEVYFRRDPGTGKVSPNGSPATWDVEAATLRAQAWAEKQEDSAVSAGKYSARHWAAKSKEFAARIDLEPFDENLAIAAEKATESALSASSSAAASATAAAAATSATASAGSSAGSATGATAAATGAATSANSAAGSATTASAAAVSATASASSAAASAASGAAASSTSAAAAATSATAAASSAAASAASAANAATSATTAITSAANAQASAFTLATWTALAAITGTAAGQGAEVLDADTGTHTDPVIGGTVANAGRFTWSASPAGWKWISATGLAGKLPASTFDNRLGNLQANALASESGFAWAVQDAMNRLAIGVDTAGKTWFSPRADLLFPAANLDTSAQARLLPAGLAWDASLPVESGFVWGVSDALGRLGFGLKPDGTFWANLASDVVIPGGTGTSIQAAILAALLPSATIEAWGDSMTAGAGGVGTTFPSTMAAALGRTVNNRGIGGQDSSQIAARQGGLPITVTVTSDQIPASGGVAVTAKSTNILYNSGNFSGTSVGTLAGVPGTMSTDAGGNWTFTRTTAGSIVSCPSGTQFIIDQAVTARDKTVIIWSGRNDSRSARSNILTCRDNILKMAQYLSPLSKRMLVVSICNGTGEGSPSSTYTNMMAANAELQRTFGDRYVDLRSYLVNFGLADAGITPLAQDTTDMAADTIPISLRSDGVHLNAAGYTLVGNFLANQIKARGW